jgi:hypothetical protein
MLPQAEDIDAGRPGEIAADSGTCRFDLFVAKDCQDTRAATPYGWVRRNRG